MLKATVLFVLFYFNSYSQTCIIAKQTKDAIFVGVESRVVVNKKFADGSHSIDTGTMCKIFTDINCNYALSGNNLIESREAIIKSIKKGGKLSEIVDRYCNDYKDELLGSLSFFAKGQPFDSFMCFVNKSQPYFSNVIFFGLESDTLFLAKADFTISADYLRNITVNYFWANYSICLAGHTDNIYKKALNQSTWKGNIPNIITNLIKIESKNNPYEVGGTIHIVKLSKKKGVKWVGSRKPPCD